MAKYRKKPVIIEAVQFICGSEVPVMEFLGLTDDCRNGDKLEFENENARINIYQPEISTLVIKTLEGEMIAHNKDYIIKGVKGEFYPCKSDIFEKTYDPVN